MDIITRATSADAAIPGSRLAVLPVGSFEQHGSHLPLATDTIVACGIAEAIAAAYGLFLLPPVTLSCSHEHAAWPGTVSISSATLRAVISDVIDSLTASETDRLVLVNGHGGNYVLGNIVQELTIGEPRAALFPGRDDWARARVDAGLASGAHEDMHAGEIETSLVMHLLPDSVHDSFKAADHEGTDPRRHLLTLGMKGYTVSGVIGMPSLGTATKGQLVLDSLTASFQDYLRVLGP